jgi:hypothetical protein
VVDLKPVSKKNMQNIFAEIGERKLILQGPTTKLQDSRFQVQEAAADHVVIKLLGDLEMLIIPYASITTLKLERQVATISYR